jgi:hypothetical protein
MSQRASTSLAPSTSDETAPAQRERFRIQSFADGLQQPARAFVVRDILPGEGVSVLAGHPGSGKSTLALDLGLSVASGRAFADHFQVEQGSLLYIAAEGRAGIFQRAEAWCQDRGLSGKERHELLANRARILPAAPQFHREQDVSALLAAVRSSGTRLVIIDTLSRTFVGGDENVARDISAYFAGVERLARALGALVLLIHHAGWDGKRERGSTALRASADSLALTTARNGRRVVTLESVKQRDAEPFPTMRFLLKKCGSSVVLNAVAPGARDLLAGEQKALQALRAANAAEGGIGLTKWGETSGIPKPTLDRHRKELLARGLIEQHDKKWLVRQ